MAVSDSHGTKTADGTEQTLADTTTAGTYQLYVDTNAMQATDVLELRVYVMVLTSGTRRVAYVDRWTGVQPTDDQIKVSVPVSTALTDSGAVRATLTQTKGTGRAYPWALLKFSP